MDFRAERNARRKLLQWVREQEKESSSRDGEEQPSVFWVNKFKTVSLGQGPEECDDRQVFSDSDTEVSDALPLVQITIVLLLAPFFFLFPLLTLQLHVVALVD